MLILSLFRNFLESDAPAMRVRRIVLTMTLLILTILLSGCASSTQQCPTPAPIPQERMAPLAPLREAESVGDIPDAYLYNMRWCRVCYIRYDELIRAVNTRQGAGNDTSQVDN